MHCASAFDSTAFLQGNLQEGANSSAPEIKMLGYYMNGEFPISAVLGLSEMFIPAYKEEKIPLSLLRNMQQCICPCERSCLHICVSAALADSNL